MSKTSRWALPVALAGPLAQDRKPHREGDRFLFFLCPRSRSGISLLGNRRQCCHSVWMARITCSSGFLSVSLQRRTTSCVWFIRVCAPRVSGFKTRFSALKTHTIRCRRNKMEILERSQVGVDCETIKSWWLFRICPQSFQALESKVGWHCCT